MIYTWSIYGLYYLYLLSWHCTESSSDLGKCGRTGPCSPVLKDGPRGHNTVPGELRLLEWLCRTLPGAASDAPLPGPTNLQLASKIVEMSICRSRVINVSWLERCLDRLAESAVHPAGAFDHLTSVNYVKMMHKSRQENQKNGMWYWIVVVNMSFNLGSG